MKSEIYGLDRQVLPAADIEAAPSILLVLETEGITISTASVATPHRPARKEHRARLLQRHRSRDDVRMSERFQQVLAGAVASATAGDDTEVDANMSKVCGGRSDAAVTR